MQIFSILVDVSMNIEETFGEFLTGDDTLRVYKDASLLFASTKERLLPLVEYIDTFAPCEQGVTVFDRVVGNAAALLLQKIFCREVYSPLGSELAARTLGSSGISYHFLETAPYIMNQAGDDMCPMERLSIGKQPEEFYQALRERLRRVS
jgi:hypothetical protein